MPEKPIFLSVGIKDFLNGLLTSTISSVVIGLYSIINAGGFPTKQDWIMISQTAIASGLGYIIKNLLTNSDGKFLSKEAKTTN